MNSGRGGSSFLDGQVVLQPDAAGPRIASAHPGAVERNSQTLAVQPGRLARGVEIVEPLLAEAEDQLASRPLRLGPGRVEHGGEGATQLANLGPRIDLFALLAVLPRRTASGAEACRLPRPGRGSGRAVSLPLSSFSPRTQAARRSNGSSSGAGPNA